MTRLGLLAAVAIALTGAACTSDTDELPARCTEVRDQNPGAPDALYTLYLDHDPARPWIAYCDGMGSGAPAEYLPLRRTDGAYNASTLIEVENTLSGTTVTTSTTNYQMVRIDPERLRVDTADRNFATTVTNATGGGDHGVALGVAAVCATAAGPSPVPATANIDLAGTGFTLADSFCSHGGTPTSGWLVTSDSGRVDMATNLIPSTMDGCAWVAPEPCPVNPWQSPSGQFLLDLAYAGDAGQGVTP